MPSINQLDMSITEICLLTGIILIIIDLFFSSDYPTHVAYILFTVGIIINFDFPILYLIIIGLLIWFGLIIFHYKIWAEFLQKINDKYIAPRHHVGGHHALIGVEASIKKVEGKLFVKINDELHNFENNSNRTLEDGDTVQIINLNSNKLIIK
jgi:prepilin signal peptidase PulO-like enzyme (type II secretory pathway)